MPAPLGLTGRRAVVTGGGIGVACASRLAAYLFSDAGSFTNGASSVWDGGWSPR